MKPLVMEASLAGRMAGLVGKYRARCLWFLKEDFIPVTVESALRTLKYIERYGDLEAWREAEEMKQCLLQSSNSKSAA